MLRILFDEVLHISPSSTLRTVTRRGKSVLETIEFDVFFPISGVVLVLGRRPATKVKRVVFFFLRKTSEIQGVVLLCIVISHLLHQVSDGVG